MMDTNIDGLYAQVVGSCDRLASQHHLKRILEASGTLTLSDEELAQMMLSLDLDGDGLISLEDIKTAFERHMEPTPDSYSSSDDANDYDNDSDHGHGPDREREEAVDRTPLHSKQQRAQPSSLRLRKHGDSVTDPDYGSPSLRSKSAPFLPLEAHAVRPSPRNAQIQPTSTASSGLRAALLTHLQDRFQPVNGDSGEIDALLEVIDEYATCRLGDTRALLDDANMQVEQLQRRCATLRQENEAISEEYQRMETDIAAATQVRRQLDDRTAELIRLQTQQWSLSHDIQALTETNGILSANLVEARKETDRLAETVQALTLARDGAESQVRSLEQDSQQKTESLESLTAERDRLNEEVQRLMQSSAQNQGLASSPQGSSLSQLRTQFSELSGLLEMRDSTIRQLREQLEDQASRLNLLRANPSSMWPDHVRGLGLSSVLGSREDLSTKATANVEEVNKVSRPLSQSAQRPQPDSTNDGISSPTALFTPDDHQHSAVNGLAPSPAPSRDTTAALSPDFLGAADSSASSSFQESPSPPTTPDRASTLNGSLRAPRTSDLPNNTGRGLAISKLATAAHFQHMDIQSLQRTAGILQDMVRQRNQLLVDELGERDRIKLEMTFKTKVVTLIRKLEQQALEQALAAAAQAAQGVAAASASGAAVSLNEASRCNSGGVKNPAVPPLSSPASTSTSSKPFFKKFW